MTLANKTALITGGGGAIGEAISTELLKNNLQVLAVVDIYSQEPKLISEWRVKFPNSVIRYYPVDVSVQKELENCYAHFVEDKKLDIVVNCAGIYNENILRRVVEVNLIGVIQSTLIAMEYMRADNGRGDGGVILNIASITGIEPISMAPTYSATKHGVISFTRALAHGRDGLGIKFLTLCPGATHSSLYGQVLKSSFMCDDELRERMKQKLILQEPEAVGRASVKQIIEGQSGSVWIIEDNTITHPTMSDIRV
ncbi:alcohol dehydrogenase 1 [Sergentomyia squamirostris]